MKENKKLEKYTEVYGDLIKMALDNKFDAIVQGNNCFCIQASGIAVEFVKNFKTNKYYLEKPEYKGDINKLGSIDFKEHIQDSDASFYVINAYTQYDFGSKITIPLDYEALTLCMRKINHYFRGFHIGLPKIGAGLAGGDWSVIKGIIQKELSNCYVTVVNYKPVEK